MSNQEPERSLIAEIQYESLQNNSSIASLLRKAKAASVKLDQGETSAWIENEIRGYKCAIEELPSYRKVPVSTRARDPRYGWIPIHTRPETHRLFHQWPVRSPIAILEGAVDERGDEGGTFYELPPELRDAIIKGIGLPFEPAVFIGTGQMVSIIDRVRNLVLDWALQLERLGVLGEGMSFSMKEKKRATQATNQIFAQNIGVIGDVTDHAYVSNRQSVYQGALDPAEIAALLLQIDQHIDGLPHDLKPNVLALTKELRVAENDDSRRRTLSSLRGVCENAGGSLVAQGIVASISSILS